MFFIKNKNFQNFCPYSPLMIFINFSPKSKVVMRLKFCYNEMVTNFLIPKCSPESLVSTSFHPYPGQYLKNFKLFFKTRFYKVVYQNENYINLKKKFFGFFFRKRVPPWPAKKIRNFSKFFLNKKVLKIWKNFENFENFFLK